MATTHGEREIGVQFTYEEDLVTATDIETGIAASGETKSEALAMLSEALELHEGGGEPIEDEETFLRENGIEPSEIGEDQTPPPWFE